MKTKTRLALGAQTFPVGPHRLQQLKGAAHVALGRLGQGLNAGEVAGLAALVEVEHQGVAVCQQAAYHRTADVHAVGRRPSPAPPVARMRRRPASRAETFGGVISDMGGGVRLY